MNYAQRRYIAEPSDDDPEVWQVIDTRDDAVVFEGLEEAALQWAADMNVPDR